jgi:hypothetical protein
LSRKGRHFNWRLHGRGILKDAPQSGNVSHCTHCLSSLFPRRNKRISSRRCLLDGKCQPIELRWSSACRLLLLNDPSSIGPLLERKLDRVRDTARGDGTEKPLVSATAASKGLADLTPGLARIALSSTIFACGARHHTNPTRADESERHRETH